MLNIIQFCLVVPFEEIPTDMETNELPSRSDISGASKVMQQQQQNPTDRGGRFLHYMRFGDEEKAVFEGPKGGKFYRTASNYKKYV